jgi:hypothetical protein
MEFTWKQLFEEPESFISFCKENGLTQFKAQGQDVIESCLDNLMQTFNNEVIESPVHLVKVAHWTHLAKAVVKRSGNEIPTVSGKELGDEGYQATIGVFCLKGMENEGLVDGSSKESVSEFVDENKRVFHLINNIISKEPITSFLKNH